MKKKLKVALFNLLKKSLFFSSLLIALAVILMLTPKLWSVLSPKDPPIGYYFLPPTYLSVYAGIESATVKYTPIPKEVEAVKNIEYKNCNGKSLQFDLYRPKNSKTNAPLLLFIHGGAWAHGDRSEYLGYAIRFARLGYVTATVTYRFVDEGVYPACVEDITDAVSFIFQNSGKYQFDPDRVALIGGSAGAHLAMLVAFEWRKGGITADSLLTVRKNHRIKVVAEMYGPVDFTTEYARNHRMITRLIGHSFLESPQLYAEASPLMWVTRNSPPVLILHGTSDRLVPISQAQLLHDKLDSLGVPNSYLPLPGWPHTMDLVQRVHDFSGTKMAEFFEQYLK